LTSTMHTRTIKIDRRTFCRKAFPSYARGHYSGFANEFANDTLTMSAKNLFRRNGERFEFRLCDRISQKEAEKSRGGDYSPYLPESRGKVLEVVVVH